MDKVNINQIYRTFRDRRVLVTGHTGFKGAWLTYWLYQMGAKIRGFSLAPLVENDLYNLLKLEEKCDSIIGDIRDRTYFEDSVVDFNPEYVFHLAAQSLVRVSYQQPVETFEINVMGTSHLLSALAKMNTPCVSLFITTDKVYQNNELNHPFKETDRLGGVDPYSASKACAELVIDSYHHSFLHPSNYESHQQSIATVRAGNVIGGGDWAMDRIIPDIAKSLKHKKPINLRNPESIRPWQHVMDPLGGYLLLAAKLTEDHRKFQGHWNFGPANNRSINVKELVEIALKEWGEGEYKINGESHKEPYESTVLRLDISKAEQSLGWKPRFTSAESIEMAIRWYKEYYNGKNAEDLIQKDIDQYINL